MSLPLISDRRSERKRVRVASDPDSLSEAEVKRMDDEAEADVKAGRYVPRGLSFSRASLSQDSHSFLPWHASAIAQSVLPPLLDRTETAIGAASTPSAFQPSQLQGVLAELKSQVVNLQAQNQSAQSQVGVLFSVFVTSPAFSLCSVSILLAPLPCSLSFF